ncbi:MAG TPA: peptidyl-prolyl cis-trans isomerase [Gemmataceae bacterium]|nr:peptidyl-prolyl cis-trans isomerase [Gemmataceae bacterium]
MLRRLLRVCHFPGRSASSLLFLVPLVPSALWSGALFSGLGCSCSEPWRLHPAEEVSPAVTPATFQSPPTPPPDMSVPSVSRSQKPDSDPPRRAGSLLDQVSYSVSAPSDGLMAARIRATVNGMPILDEEVRETIYPVLLATQPLPEPERSQRRAEAFKQALQQLIDRETILQDMNAKLKDRPMILDKVKELAGKEFDKRIREVRKQMKIKTDEELKAALRAQGLTLEGLRRQIERGFMSREYMQNRVFASLERAATLEQIVEYYKNHPEEFEVKDSVTWQDIFVDAGKYPNRDAARQAAQAVADKARRGGDFLQLVAQFDNGDSTYRNGEGYGHHRGEIKPPDAEPLLFKMADGEVGPILEQANGYHVIRLVKREHAGVKPLDEKVQKAIRNKLENAALEREYKRLLADLRRRATIEISTGTP